MTLASIMDAAERQVIEAALAQCDQNRRRTAKLLDVSLRALQYKLRRLGFTLQQRSAQQPRQDPVDALDFDAVLEAVLRQSAERARRAFRPSPAPEAARLGGSFLTRVVAEDWR